MNQKMRDASWVVATLGPAPVCAPGPMEIRALAERLERRHLEPGTVLFTDRKKPDGVWVIAGGAVEIVVSAGRTRRVIQVAKTGDTVGDPYLVLDIKPHCTARVIEPTESLFLPADAFLALIAEHAPLCAVWLYNVAIRVLQSRKRLMEVLGGTLPERVARLLTEEADDGVLRLPQRTIAQMLGAQRTSVNKVLRAFADDGLVALDYGRVVLKDKDCLRQIASEGEKTLAALMLEGKKNRD